MHIPLACFVSVLLSMFLTAAVFGEGYKIKINRPDKVGDEYRTTISAKFIQTADMLLREGQPQPQKSDGFTAELHGTIKVLAVNDKAGAATRISCKVDQISRNGVDGYPAGTVIIAEKVGQKTSFTANGVAVEGDNAKVLDLLFILDNPDRTTNDDQLFGTDQPQQVGGTWPINPDNVAGQIADDNLPVTGSMIKGKNKLVEIKRVNDVEAMTVSTTFTAEGIKKDNADGSTVSDGKLIANADLLVPTDASLPIIKRDYKYKMTFNMVLANNLGTAVVSFSREIHQQREPHK
jgi:hypothetical protein